MAYKIDYQKIDPYQLNVFAESRKRRVFVGNLKWDQNKNCFEFKYDQKYAGSKKAIPIGKELDLFKKTHISKKKLFPSLLDRIPSKDNPAYKDYCLAQGISPDETNPIILLVSIGRKGPSSFIFEPVIKPIYDVKETKNLRDYLDVSINDLCLALDLNNVTLTKVESGQQVDVGTLRRLQIYFTFPKVALWQLELNAGKLHSDVLFKIWNYFENLSKKRKNNIQS